MTKAYLQRAGLVQMAKTHSAHRKKRPRRPMVGMMPHQDASTHAWLPGDERKYDLAVTMEDATGALYSAFLVDQEGFAPSFRGLREVVAAQVCSARSTAGRALSQLGIEHIAAYSPQARGRSERVFLTLQDRLPKDFELGRDRHGRGRQHVAAGAIHS